MTAVAKCYKRATFVLEWSDGSTVTIAFEGGVIQKFSEYCYREPFEFGTDFSFTLEGKAYRADREIDDKGNERLILRAEAHVEETLSKVML